MKLPSGGMTNGIALLTLIAFLLIYITGQVDNAAVLGGFIPARLSSPDPLSGLAAVPVWLTPFSCTLVHAGWIHIAFNLLMLIFCGRQVEHVLGKGSTLLLYIAGAYGAALAQWLAGQTSPNPMVGASGAISAILATYALLYSQQQVRRIGPFSANIVRVLWLAGGWIAIQVMIGIATKSGFSDLGQIAVAAHIGGFIVGLILTRPLLRWRFRKTARRLS